MNKAYIWEIIGNNKLMLISDLDIQLGMELDDSHMGNMFLLESEEYMGLVAMVYPDCIQEWKVQIQMKEQHYQIQIHNLELWNTHKFKTLVISL